MNSSDTSVSQDACLCVYPPHPPHQEYIPVSICNNSRSASFRHTSPINTISHTSAAHSIFVLVHFNTWFSMDSLSNKKGHFGRFTKSISDIILYQYELFYQSIYSRNFCYVTNLKLDRTMAIIELISSIYHKIGPALYSHSNCNDESSIDWSACPWRSCRPLIKGAI